jgi:hypothetical protein
MGPLALLKLAPMAMKLVQHSPMAKMMGGGKADGEAGSMAPQNPMKMLMGGGGGGMMGGIMGGGGGAGGMLSGAAEKAKGFMGQ